MVGIHSIVHCFNMSVHFDVNESVDTGILTGSTDVFFLVYEQDSFPVLKIIRIQDNKNEFKKGNLSIY